MKDIYMVMEFLHERYIYGDGIYACTCLMMIITEEKFGDFLSISKLLDAVRLLFRQIPLIIDSYTNQA